MSKYTISFCIATYNRADATKKLIDELLRCKREDIQFVISDNYSNDGTWEILTQYHDERLKICKNESDGTSSAQSNWYNALQHGDGEWLYLVMGGRDRLYSSKIDELVQKIKILDENYGVVLDRGVDIPITDRIDEILLLPHYSHPTGVIFKKKAFEHVRNRKNIFTEKNNFPENVLSIEIMKKYRGISVNSGVYRGTKYIDIGNERSSFHKNKTLNSLWFMPNQLTKSILQLIEITDSYSVVLPDKDFLKLQTELYQTGMSKVTYSFKIHSENIMKMRHHGLDARNVGQCEMLKNCLVFFMRYTGYCLKNNYKWFTGKFWVHIVGLTLKKMVEIVLLRNN